MVFIPMSAITNHQIENRQQLAHRGALDRFASGAPPSIKGVDDLVKTDGG